ncbi:unnamed protein product [Gongylonema pulchrum]|uniref:Glutathione S-transferase n=1 Tax=Gongylonema pulchrum TaxID=637853 RepID=A0A183DFN3_9BILA|nr:unnamed protein product [Gongylonema pulchrum]
MPSTSGLPKLRVVPVVIYEKPQKINMKMVLKELYADRNVFQVRTRINRLSYHGGH